MALAQLLSAAADQEPTRADWLAAWAGLVAAFGTVGTLIWQARSLKEERDTRREEVARIESEQREAQDAQARTVVLHHARCGGNQWMVVREFAVTFGNYGSHPVTNIRATLTLRETQQALNFRGPNPLPVIKAGDQEHLTWNLEGYNVVWPGEMGDQELPSLFDCEAEFTDVNGIRWAVQPGLGQQPSRVFGT